MSSNRSLSPLIRRSGHLALAFLVLIPASVLGVKFGVLDYRVGLLGFALGGLFSLSILLVLAVVSLLPQYKTQRQAALIRSLPALPGVLLTGALAGSSGDYPAIHDIATDTANPPVFVRGVIERGTESNTLDIKRGTIEAQLRAYPDLGTIESGLNIAGAMARAADIAAGMNWEIYNHDAEARIIEATDTTFWFGFVDDIVIRFTPTASGVNIDLRSVSRVGRGDLGANANRIRAFARAFAKSS